MTERIPTDDEVLTTYATAYADGQEDQIRYGKAFTRWLTAHDAKVRAAALRAAAEQWRPLVRYCPTCQGSSRETVGMVCQTCGHDYGTEP